MALNWAPVQGATGYVVDRSTGDAPEFKWPAISLTALVETVYTDSGNVKIKANAKELDNTSDYSYEVTAVNAGGCLPASILHIPAS